MFRGKILLGLMLASIIFAAADALSQEFPYAAPKAPEFDDLGNVMAPGRTEASPPAQTRQSYPRQERSTPRPPRDYRAVRPYTPADTPPMGPNAASQRPQYEPPYRTPQPSAPSAAVAPSRASGQTQGRPDCSHYPVMIAQARSEPEMRSAAQQFLTCLLKSGWQYEAAREYIIKTIETYRLAR